MSGFQPINPGYNSVFNKDQLSLGLVVPIERYADSPIPTMLRSIERIRLAEDLGFKAVWLRDVPFNVPSFGDAGQIYDPFVYLGFLAAQTRAIALGVASIIIPLRHPAHIAKAAASVDVLSGGRLILGIASGDRPQEYPGMNISYMDRGTCFRFAYDYIREMSVDYPEFDNIYGSPTGTMDLLPKPTSGKLPLLITGGCQQTQDWIEGHGDGWMLFPREVNSQESMIREWRENSRLRGEPEKPVMEPLYIDLLADPDAEPQPIHLGLQLGVKHLLKYLISRRRIGVNHIALNLRFNQANIEDTINLLAEVVLPEFQPEKE